MPNNSVAAVSLLGVSVFHRRGSGERIRPKLTFEERDGVSFEESACDLARGAIAARVEALLLAEGFVAELEREFGIDEAGALALLGASMLALLPHAYGEPAESVAVAVRAADIRAAKLAATVGAGVVTRRGRRRTRPASGVTPARPLAG